ncbi:MAG: radical SAM protein [Tepidisphaerales bacterium]
MHRVFAGLCRSRCVDQIAGCLARVVIAGSRGRTVDYAQLAEPCACEGDCDPQSTGDDIEHAFLCGIMNRPATRAKLPGFLQSLEGLDFGIRSGLLKTWFHAGVVTPLLREAGARGMRPIDAIVAPFGRCNLRCRGCYALGELGQESASPARLDYTIRQLKELNVYHILLVGKGEPFHDAQSRRSLFDVVRRHPQIFFSVYSNGTRILPGDVAQLRHLPNLMTLLSIDGPEEINDWRRGAGVYAKVIDAFHRLRDAGLFFGYISTVFRQNCQAVLDPRFVNEMVGHGCRLGYYSQFIFPAAPAADPERMTELAGSLRMASEGQECADRQECLSYGPFDDRQECLSHRQPALSRKCHGPADPADPAMMLDRRGREEYFQRFKALDAAVPIPLIDVDGIEAHVGCRAKCGATVYIDAVTGQVSPCIRAPVQSDQCNIYRPAASDRLKQILQSEPFCRFRQDRPPFTMCEAFAKADVAAKPSGAASSA